MRPNPHPSRGRVRRRSVSAALVALVAAALLVPTTSFAVSDPHDGHDAANLDARSGRVLPNAAQRSIVQRLGGRATWNRFGTPHSLINDAGYLATGVTGADAATAARRWIDANRALFRLTSTTPETLELVNSSRLGNSNGYAVLFRQRFGSLVAGHDGMITVGLAGSASAGWKIAYVSSSSAGTQAAPGAATLSPTAAWLRAARHVGRSVTLPASLTTRQQGGWTTFDLAGFTHPQRARLVAVPIPGNGVRAAFETIVLDNDPRRAMAFTVFVDARSGAILLRQNRTQNLAHAEPAPAATTAAAPRNGNFTGTTGASSAPATDSPSCGVFHEFPVDDANESVDLVAVADSPANDMVLKLFRKTGATTYVELASFDSGTNPEAGHYPIGTQPFPPGTYAAQVCRYTATEPHFGYTGFYFVNDAGSSSALPFPPKWRFFRDNPHVIRTNHTDTRVLGCWRRLTAGAPIPGCSSYRELANLASRTPWDVEVEASAPTFTTKGNNASTSQAWYSPLTPAEQYRPFSPGRSYDFPWADQWNKSRCAGPVTPATPNRNDIDAAIVNLFTFHNRMHDFAYFLGFTEQNYNLQQNNFGEGQPGGYPFGREADPEIGNAQAGAGLPVFVADAELTSVTNRNNANQITLNDGIPGITNQYLFQPVAGLNYPPCADGDFDGSVIGHEYTHAISNRMVGGPDSNIDSHQGGAMGESWSDQVAVEHVLEYGDVSSYSPNPWVIGPYVTGNNVNGIRNFAINTSPLNYSDVGYDAAGPGVHADGEIWSATGYDIRQALAAKYDASYPSTSASLNRECAEGRRPANLCPGNRRWIQIMFDAFLLMPPSISMLDARDAYLAADRLRFGGANQRELWTAFARRGMGVDAATRTGDDTDPKPGFMVPASILSAANHSTVRFIVRNESGAAIPNASIYVGRFEARATPVADTRPTDSNASTPEYPDRVDFVPGTYEFLAHAPGYGVLRSPPIALIASDRDLVFTMPSNWASKTKGGAVTATSEGVNKDHLIDDTETTNWGILGKATGINGSTVTVDLGGGAHRVTRVQVSALHHAPGSGDDAVQSRFINLRSFRILACDSRTSDCSKSTSFRQISSDTTANGLTGTVNAFPGPRPRPATPHLNLRSFAVRPRMATHIRLVALTNQCTGNPQYQGEQDADPANVTDCGTVSVNSTNLGVPEGDTNLRAAELQVFSAAGSVAALPTTVPPVSIGNATVTEPDAGSVTATFTLRLASAHASSVTVRYATSNGTAAAGSDYTAETGSVTFAAGQTTRTIGIAVRGDRVDEPTERFSVTLSGSPVGDGRGEGTILDDDTAPSLSVNSPTVTERDTTVSLPFTVRLSAASGKTVRVNYRTRDGSARAPKDYAARSGTLTFAPGETTKRVNVAVAGENVREDTERLYLDLSAPVNATVSTPTGTGFIRDDDPDDPLVALTKSAPATAAPGSLVTYTLSWHNLGPLTSHNASLVDALPAGVRFSTASDGGVYDIASHTVRWSLGDVAVNAKGTRSVVVAVAQTAADGTAIVNTADFYGEATVSATAAAVTVVRR